MVKLGFYIQVCLMEKLEKTPPLSLGTAWGDEHI